jgi:hypothetical protein
MVPQRTVYFVRGTVLLVLCLQTSRLWYPCYVSLNYNSHEDIYSAALSALTQFTICISKQYNGE